MSEIDDLHLEVEKLRTSLEDARYKLFLVTEFDYSADDLAAFERREDDQAEQKRRADEIRANNAARPVFGRPETGRLIG